MAGSPFAGKGGNATATKTPAAAPSGGGKSSGKVDPADLPDVTNVGEDAPVSNDPYAAADPAGISGYKPLFFLNQLVLLHPTEYGSMKTVQSTPEKPESEFCRFDIIPLTVPEPGQINNTVAVVNDDGEFAVINKDGDTETCEAWEVGERLDDVLVFNIALVNEGKKALNKGTAWLLGRIIKGNKKSANRSAPYILVAGSDEDKALYQAWRQEAAKQR